MGTPDKVKQARNLWTNVGKARPPFAILPHEDQESVWDYPRPPVIVPDGREVVVRFRGIELARTNAAIRVCETASPPTFYLPAEHVLVTSLSPSDGHSFCEWKGQATYWSLVAGDHPRQSNIGWSYEQPFPEFDAIRGYFSFYPARVDCYVDKQAVRPQPGGMGATSLSTSRQAAKSK